MLSKPVTINISSRKAVVLSCLVVFTLLVGFFILAQVFVVPKAQANPHCTVNDDLVVQNGKTLTVGGIARSSWVPDKSSFSVSRKCLDDGGGAVFGIGSTRETMGNKDNCVCFLNSVRLVEIDEDTEYATCEILSTLTNWILSATLDACGDQEAHCSASCICW